MTCTEGRESGGLAMVSLSRVLGDVRRSSIEMLIDPNKREMAVDLQAKSYALLKWVGQAVSSGLLSFRSAHEYSTLPLAAKDWIEKHYLNIPETARADRAKLLPFANMFSTYLENSFDLIATPGRVKYSPDAHCFCPM